MENKLLNYIKKNNKGQGALETVIVFIAMIVLFGAMFNIWLWANNQIVRRQISYNASRVAAGTSSDGYTMQWPVYTPEELSESDVLVGNQ